MNISGIVKGIAHFFSSPKAKAIEVQIESAIVSAQPIVGAIAALVPNRTVQEIAAAYSHYAVPFAQSDLQTEDPRMKAVLVRDLAVKILQKNHQDAAAQTLNTAVEIALAAFKAS